MRLAYDPLRPRLDADFMSQGASLGVLIPTRNSAALLPVHVSSLARWIDLADEVLVVDSFSTDGTVEYLREHLKHPRLRFLSHPPGLYASWNAGIQALTSQYAYISTIGDTITRSGLQQLLDTALTLDADVVLSKPDFRRPSGAPVHINWPIDDVIRSLQITAPRRLDRLEAIVFASVHVTGALTGSCASDLFRAECLKRRPFPIEYGTAGDGIWGLQQAGRLAWAVLPDAFSTFLLHETTRSQSENRASAGAAPPHAVLQTAMEEWRREGLVTEADLKWLDWSSMTAALSGYLEAKGAFDRYRRASLPWILNPRAWTTRARRDRCQAKLEEWKASTLQRISSRSGQPLPAIPAPERPQPS